MGTVCGKCGYERTPGDPPPEYECPRCGVIYAKAIPGGSRRREPAPPVTRVQWSPPPPTQKKRGAGRGIMVALLALFVGAVAAQQAGVVDLHSLAGGGEIESPDGDEGGDGPADDEMTAEQYAKKRMRVECRVEGSKFYGRMNCIFLNTGAIEVSAVQIVMTGSHEEMMNDAWKKDEQLIREKKFEHYTFDLEGPFLPGKKKGVYIEPPEGVTALIARATIQDLTW